MPPDRDDRVDRAEEGFGRRDVRPGRVRRQTARRPETQKRIRLTPEERVAQILEAATDLVARRGYYGLSLQEVAEAVGISIPGLLHYVQNKDGLLRMLVAQRYDRRGTPDDFIATGDAAAVHPDGVSFPAYCRYLVAYNASRPELMKLYVVLGAEAASPEHPAYDYFVGRPPAVWDFYCQTRWRLPPEIGGFERMHELVELAIEAMDGVQLRWFRRPPIDLSAEWARFERVLFPSPVWDGYR